jgi:hypothetical protein
MIEDGGPRTEIRTRTLDGEDGHRRPMTATKATTPTPTTTLLTTTNEGGERILMRTSVRVIMPMPR